MTRVPSLDGLRALSIGLVIVCHLYDRPLLGVLGVHLFFVISGYLITRLLLEERAKTGRLDLLAFFRRRCYRIFPAALAYMGIISLTTPEARRSLLAALTYTAAWHPANMATPFVHLWSLSIEEHFYLLWPLALVLFFNRRSALTWSVVLFAAAYRLLVSTAPAPFPALYIHYSPPGAMDSIAAGCLAALYGPRFRDHWALVPSVGIACVSTAFALSPLLWAGASSVLWFVVPALLAFGVLSFSRSRPWLLNNRIICAVGVGSYSLYLWQEPFTVGSRFSVPMSLLLMSVCASASYFLIERPMLNVGKRALVCRARPQKISPAAM